MVCIWVGHSFVLSHTFVARNRSSLARGSRMQNARFRPATHSYTQTQCTICPIRVCFCSRASTARLNCSQTECEQVCLVCKLSIWPIVVVECLRCCGIQQKLPRLSHHTSSARYVFFSRLSVFVQICMFGYSSFEMQNFRCSTAGYIHIGGILLYLCVLEYLVGCFEAPVALSAIFNK